MINIFNLSKSASQEHQLLGKTSGKSILSENSGREWFLKYKNLTPKIKNVAKDGIGSIFGGSFLLIARRTCI